MQRAVLYSVWLIAGWLLALPGAAAAASEQQRTEAFLQRQFSAAVPRAQRLWLNAESKARIEGILGHAHGRVSHRYWRSGDKTVWILDEIGKERDITTAVVLQNDRISEMKVLVYRESRGGEVQAAWFTNQFIGVDATRPDWQQSIDGISGATLSVQALKKQAETALYLNQLVNEKTAQKGA